ncbi:MAG: nitrous oxide-stimulated promoter family protein [Oligoflexia bacterium]|nr:nitrous oxide-stimulated promoter family protein [Oligoflexia bacterium]
MIDNKKIKHSNEHLIAVMIHIFCKNKHSLDFCKCKECNDLLMYAIEQSNKCKWNKNYKIQPTCSQCSIHCYKPEYKEQIKKVMRYSGPRVFFYHPVLTLWYLKKKFRYWIFKEMGLSGESI